LFKFVDSGNETIQDQIDSLESYMLSDSDKKKLLYELGVVVKKFLTDNLKMIRLPLKPLSDFSFLEDAAFRISKNKDDIVPDPFKKNLKMREILDRVRIEVDVERMIAKVGFDSSYYPDSHIPMDKLAKVLDIGYIPLNIFSSNFIMKTVNKARSTFPYLDISKI